MLSDALTRHNHHLSGPNRSDRIQLDLSAINVTWADRCPVVAVREEQDTLLARVAELAANSISESTRRAYQSDLIHFEAWGGRLPASPEHVASYLAAYADDLSVATLVRRIATLSKVHEMAGHPNPCRSEIVRATLRGIKRTRGTAQRQAKPLLKEDLVLVLNSLNETVRDTRDRALLLLGFLGGFRRSELVGLDHDDIVQVRQGLIATLRFSKTDQEGKGREIGIPYGRTRNCPVAALQAWLSHSDIHSGPIFRPVDRHGHVKEERLSGEAVSLVIRCPTSAPVGQNEGLHERRMAGSS
ncbi:integrase [Methylobacterium sp. WL69]|uniref:site-specific integrase n=1 Tax=Methylobacterium sp. WL69 TaxID=2603893 RepID=UPI0011C856EC|nr:site-specific integrase [Methylobacterium sp. WL69]TXM73119.1 integrase [Methylobacterium sp. WL69]